jgi:hypothetical protein
VRINGVDGVSRLRPSARGGFMAVLGQETRRLSFNAEAILRDGTRKRIP